MCISVLSCTEWEMSDILQVFCVVQNGNGREMSDIL